MDKATKCPLCKSPVRVARRADGAADHYEVIETDDRQVFAPPITPALAGYLRSMRKGKKTVAMVGASWLTGAWAPWGEEEVWGMNELHGIPWYQVDGVTRWFQMHDKSIFTRGHTTNHWQWLQEDHGFPVYMQRNYDAVPNSTKYPLREVQDKLIGNFIRGEEKIKKLFSSTFNYMVALALYEGYERIEIFGIEMLGEGEYGWQREAMAFWLGKADGMGVDIWIPESCTLLNQLLYGYEEVRKGDTGEVIWAADNVVSEKNDQD